MKKSTIIGVLALLAFALGLWALLSGPNGGGRPESRPSLVLITLDTTRSDYLSSYGAAAARTPHLDRLAKSGILFSKAITASPLTLPAHASLLTGLEPPRHGLLDNGTAVLDPGFPTLAEVLKARGYTTGAFVSSRVLDRRFGLNQGFDTYDDFMAAEELSEYGYPERKADAVTSAAIGWLELLPASEPYFLWIHYYDPHSPYEPPARWKGSTIEADYAGEIAFVDQQVGRLLESLPTREPKPLIAVVGDHGESLGEHGERAHGIFLYRAVLEVPLFLTGPGAPVGAREARVVATLGLAATLISLTVGDPDAAPFGARLPGFPSLGEDPPLEPVYSATWMPATAYGWSALRALTTQRWRFVEAPKPELYDFVADPMEANNRIEEHQEEALQLQSRLSSLEQEWESLPPVGQQQSVDPQLLSALRSLGYVSGSAGDHEPAAADSIDPKDGIHLLSEFERAKQLVVEGNAAKAIPILRNLTEQNPRNIPFLTQLARAQLEGGDGEGALGTYRAASRLNPALDFLRLNLADALRRLNRYDEATQEYEKALEINPRSASAWLALAEMALQSGGAAEEQRLLLQALETGTASAMIRCRLGQIESAAGNAAVSEIHFLAATELAPNWALPWVLWGEQGEALGRPEAALARYLKAVSLDPDDPAVQLRLGRLYMRTGQTDPARTHLAQVLALAPESPEAQEAKRLLQ